MRNKLLLLLNASNGFESWNSYRAPVIYFFAMMIIFVDFRHLIVSGFVLMLVNSAWNYPHSAPKKPQSSGRFMTLTRKPCEDQQGNFGTCMFKWDCISLKGVTLTTCMDGFLFGACCKLNENQKHQDYMHETYANIPEDENEMLPEVTTMNPLQLHSKFIFSSENTKKPFTEISDKSPIYSTREKNEVEFSISTTTVMPTLNENSISFENISLNFISNEINKTNNNSQQNVSYFSPVNDNILNLYNLTNNTFENDEMYQTQFTNNFDNLLNNDSIIGEKDYLKIIQSIENIGFSSVTSMSDPVNFAKYTEYEENEFLTEESALNSEINSNVPLTDNLYEINASKFFLDSLTLDNYSTIINSSDDSVDFEYLNITKSALIFLLTGASDYDNLTFDFYTKNEMTDIFSKLFKNTLDYQTNVGSLLKNTSKTNNELESKVSPVNDIKLVRTVSSTIPFHYVKTSSTLPMPDSHSSLPPQLDSNDSSSPKNVSMNVSTQTYTSVENSQGNIISNFNGTTNVEPLNITDISSGNMTIFHITVIDEITDFQHPLQSSNFSISNITSTIPEENEDEFLENVKTSEFINYFKNTELPNTTESSTHLNVSEALMPYALRVSLFEGLHHFLTETTVVSTSEDTVLINTTETSIMDDYLVSDSRMNEISDVHSVTKHTFIPLETSNSELSVKDITTSNVLNTNNTLSETNSETTEIRDRVTVPFIVINNDNNFWTEARNETNYESIEKDLTSSTNSKSEEKPDKVSSNSPVTSNSSFTEVIELTQTILFNTSVTKQHFSQSDERNASILLKLSEDQTSSLFLQPTENPSQSTMNGVTLDIAAWDEPPITENNENFFGSTVLEPSSSINTYLLNVTDSTKYHIFKTTRLNYSQMNDYELAMTSNVTVQNDIDSYTNNIVDLDMNTLIGNIQKNSSASFSEIVINSSNVYNVSNEKDEFSTTSENDEIIFGLTADFELTSRIHFGNTPSSTLAFTNELNIIQGAEIQISTSAKTSETEINIKNCTGLDYSTNTESSYKPKVEIIREDMSFSPDLADISTQNLNMSFSQVSDSEVSKVSAASLITLQSEENTTILSEHTEFTNESFTDKYEETKEIVIEALENSVLDILASDEMGATAENISTLEPFSKISAPTFQEKSTIAEEILNSEAVSENNFNKASVTNHVISTVKNETYSKKEVSTTPYPWKPYSSITQESTVHNHRWNYKKDCGVRMMYPTGRIVGGQNTYFGKWPWQVLVKEATWLGLFVKNKCGGVLITSKYVLTAAHCQPGFLASLLVVLGTYDLSGTSDYKPSVIRNVKRMVIHRHYNAQTFENDLALLEMETEVEFLPHVVPICLPHRNEDFTGNMAFVTGWGKLTHGGDVPNILQEVQVPIVANDECQSMFYQAGHQKVIRSNFVCAGYTNGGQDSCEGDSGGPLMVQREDKRWVLVGTVSHGIGCADPNLPGVYMRMSSYRPWIDSIIGKNKKENSLHFAIHKQFKN